LSDDSTAVKVSGVWKRKFNIGGCFGPSLLQDESTGVSADNVTFTPSINAAGNYAVYTYVVKAPGMASQITFNIDSDAGETIFVLNMKDVVVQGQTEGEWVPIGNYHFSSGKKGSVTATGKNANGTVIADAVLCVPAPSN
jgi:hypothetical protein